MKPYFVMLNSEIEGEITPLKNIVGSVLRFENELEARKAGHENILGKTYGFEVHEVGTGLICYTCQDN